MHLYGSGLHSIKTKKQQQVIFLLFHIKNLLRINPFSKCSHLRQNIAMLRFKQTQLQRAGIYRMVLLQIKGQHYSQVMSSQHLLVLSSHSSNEGSTFPAPFFWRKEGHITLRSQNFHSLLEDLGETRKRITESILLNKSKQKYLW